MTLIVINSFILGNKSKCKMLIAFLHRIICDDYFPLFCSSNDL